MESNLILQWLQKYAIAKAGDTRGSRIALLLCGAEFTLAPLLPIGHQFKSQKGKTIIALKLLFFFHLSTFRDSVGELLAKRKRKPKPWRGHTNYFDKYVSKTLIGLALINLTDHTWIREEHDNLSPLHVKTWWTYTFYNEPSILECMMDNSLVKMRCKMAAAFRKPFLANLGSMPCCSYKLITCYLWYVIDVIVTKLTYYLFWTTSLC